MALRFESLYLDTPLVGGRVLDIFHPAKITQPTALFFVHGGGWHAGSRSIFHTIIQAMMQRGFVCAATDYRLRSYQYKGVLIGEQLMDVRHAYMAFAQRLAELDRPRKIVVYGVSAGAHLAWLASMTRPGECGDPVAHGTYDLAKMDWIVPAGVAVQSLPAQFEPWDEISPAIAADMADIVGTPHAQSPELYHRVSPMRYVRAGLAPCLLMNAGYEHLFPLTQIHALATASRKVGNRVEMIDYPNVEHGFFYDVTRSSQKKALDDLVAFAQSV